MKLAAYMTAHRITPETMAAQIGGVSVSGLVKWMRDERVPRPDQQRRIFDVTSGEVSPNDFVLAAAPAEGERAA